MLLVTHLVVAVASLVFSTYLFFIPTKLNIKIAYGLLTATLASGTALVVLLNSPLLHACLSGLVYLSIVASLIVMADRKLAKQL